MEGKRPSARTLVSRLCSVYERTRAEALCELRLITKHDEESRPLIAEAGAIPYLAESLYSSSHVEQENAAATLLNLSITSREDLISTRGLLDALSHALRHHSDTSAAAAVQSCAATIHSLLVVGEYRPIVGSKRDIVYSLIDILKSGRSPPRSIKDALKALFGIALYQPNRSTIIDLGAVPPLFSLVVVGGRAGMMEDATAVIAQIAGCEESEEAFRKVSGMGVLVDLLDLSTGSSLRTKENAVSALLNLANFAGERAVRDVRDLGVGVLDGISKVAENGSAKGKSKAVSLMEVIEGSINEILPLNNGGTGFLHSCFNALNALSGIGLIAIPYTLARSGWIGLSLLFAMAMITWYTGILVERCLSSNASIKTYPDIAFHAYGKIGKITLSTLTYFELYLVATGILIMEGDNLHKLFPNIRIHVTHKYFIEGRSLFIITVGLIILPSMLLKDMTLLSFVSAGGVLSSFIIMCSILWAGAVDKIGFFTQSSKVFDLAGIPEAVSIYAFCFAAHSVFPTLRRSMRDRSQFSKVLLISFGLSSLSYICMGIIGYSMFGQKAQSQITLNLPTNKISSKVAIYTTLVGPIAKYALIMTPIADTIESKLHIRLLQKK